MADKKETGGSEGGIALLLHQTSKAAFGIAGHVFYHILSLANKKL